MASLQTNAILSSPNAANAAIKSSLPPAGSEDFAALLNGAAAPDKTQAKTQSHPPAPDGKSTASAPHAKHNTQASNKTDNKTGNKTDNKTGAKADRKSAAKPDDTANAKPDTAKSAPQARQATADAADADSDATGDSTGTDATINQNSADAVTAAPALQPPQQGTQAQQMLAAATQAIPQASTPAAASANDNNNAAPAKDSDPQTGAQAPQISPAQPPEPAPPQTDASAQAQQMLAAPAAQTNAPLATTSANDNNNVTTPAAKAGRPQAPRMQAGPANSDGAAPAAAKTGTNAASDTQNAGITADTPASAAEDSLKSAGHSDGKVQSADVKPDTAPQASQAAPPPPAPQPAPQPTPQPASASLAANIVGPPAPANGPGAAANPGLAASIHVAPQASGVTPNVNSLAVEIAARSQSGAKEFQIRLDPPELGHVEVRLSIDASGKAEAHMSADQQQTLDLLQKNSPALTSALRDAGLDVSQSGLNFSLRGQDRQGGDNNGGTQRSGASHALAATKTIDAVQSANPYLSSAGDARLDIHV